MSDLIERIRNRIHDSHMDTERLLDDSADELERLRAELAAAPQQQAEPVAHDLDVIRQAIEERDAAQQAVDDLAFSMVYKGNSVAFIYQKAEAYKNALGKAWDALHAAGIKATGNNTVADGIAELAAASSRIATEPVAYRYKVRDHLGREVWVTYAPAPNEVVFETQPLYASPRITAEQADEIKRLAQAVEDSAADVAQSECSPMGDPSLKYKRQQLAEDRAAIHAAIDALVKGE